MGGYVGSSTDGRGGFLHQSNVQRELEIEQSGYQQIQRQQILVMTPELGWQILPFTQQTYDQVFKYDTQPGKPTLHPLVKLRGTGAAPKKKAPWPLVYAKLLELLPSDIKETLNIQNKRTVSERDTNYVTLNNLLVTTSMGYAWVDSATTPIEPNTSADSQNQLNLNLPFIALEGFSIISQNILKETREMLEEIGHNHPQYIEIKELYDQIQDISNRLDEIRENVVKGSKESIETLKELAAEIDLIYNNYQKKELNSDFQVLGSQLYALNTLAQSLTVEWGSPPLIIGYAVSALGMGENQSELGLFGSPLELAFNGITDGIFILFDITPAAEVNEMIGLRDQLTEFRDSGE